MKNKSHALLWAITDCILLSVMSVIMKHLMNTGGDIFNIPFQIIFIAAIVIFIFAKFTKQDLHIGKEDFKSVLFIAVLSSLIGYPVWLLGLKYTTVINAAFLGNFSIIFTIILSYLFLKERYIGKKILLIFILLFGCYLLTTKGHLSNLSIGDFIVIGGALNFSIAMLFTEKLLGKINLIVFSFYRAFLGSLMLFIGLLIFGKVDIHFDPVILFVGLITGFGIIVFSKTIYHGSANYSIQMKTMSPILTSILAFIFLGERMILIQIIGAGIILFSLYFLHKYHD